jgi:hypothetical protein
MDQSMLQKVVAYLRGGPSVQTAVNPAYTNYAREAQAMGQQPMNPQQFAMQQMQAQAPQQPQPMPQPQEPPKEFRF